MAIPSSGVSSPGGTLLDGKVAVVTGGGRGIGRAAALAIGRAGARVLVNDTGGAIDGSGHDASVAKSVVDELFALGADALASDISVATRDGARSVVDLAVEQYGKVDIMVHCAGIAHDATLFKVTEAQWAELVGVHAGAALWCMQAAGERMRRQGSGSLILTTGASGALGNFGQAATAAANAAVFGLVRTASIELQRYGVRVNAVAPLAKTRATESLPLFEHIDTMTADHVAPVYTYLGSDLAKDTTGQVISISGGRLCLWRFSEIGAGFKDTDGSIWTPTEIADHFASVRR
jgi:NAD(P)-dependent dehydrogenase (short-subunit alcohol dehydrogenase family)